MNHNIIEQIKREIPSNVKIVAVTKAVRQSKILQLINAGQIYFAENRVQEAREKWLILKKDYPQIKLHYIGHLQRNKIKQVLELFDVIETIDSFKLAEDIAKEAIVINKEFFVQVNIGNEFQKSGVDKERAVELVEYCLKKLSLNIKGLMCIPPKDVDPKPYFLALKSLADKACLRELSMGMSADYQEAISAGATQIRLGRIITGLFNK